MNKPVIITFLAFFVVFNACSKKGVEPTKARIVSITATSTLAHNQNIYKVENLIDKNLSTVWAEGDSGHGIGQSIKITFDKVVKLTGFYIQNGANSPKYYKMNARVKEFLVNGKQKVTLPDKGHDMLVWVKFKEPVVSKTLTLKILSVYEGTKWKDTCITEIAFKGYDFRKYSNRIKKRKILNYRLYSGPGGELHLYPNNTFKLKVSVDRNSFPNGIPQELTKGQPVVKQGDTVIIEGNFTKSRGTIRLGTGEERTPQGGGMPMQNTYGFDGFDLELNITSRDNVVAKFKKIWSYTHLQNTVVSGLHLVENYTIKLFMIKNDIIPSDPGYGIPAGQVHTFQESMMPHAVFSKPYVVEEQESFRVIKEDGTEQQYSN